MTPEERYESMKPSRYKDGLDERLEGHWGLAYGVAPVPLWNVSCPVCRDTQEYSLGGNVIIRRWMFHSREGSGSKRPWRCDVFFKCVDCSFAWVHGVVVPREVYDMHVPGKATKEWRDMAVLIQEHGQ